MRDSDLGDSVNGCSASMRPTDNWSRIRSTVFCHCSENPDLQIQFLPDPVQGPARVRGRHPGVHQVVDAGAEHADQFGGRATAGDGPVHDVKQGGKQPVVQGEVGAEIRERARVRLRGAQPHGPQAVRAEREGDLLLAVRRLGGPAQPGPPAAERRVVVEIARCAGSRRAPARSPRPGQGPSRSTGRAGNPAARLSSDALPKHFEHPRLSEVVRPRATAAGAVMTEGRVGPGLDDAPVGQ